MSAPDLLVSFIVSTIPVVLVAATPVFFAGLGELFAEKSGVLNFGLEGIMLVAAATAFIATLLASSLSLGLLVAVAAGLAFGVIVSVLAVTLRVNQIVLALGIFLIGPGLSSFLVLAAKSEGTRATIDYLRPIDIPVLGAVPILGEVLRQNILVLVSICLIPISYLVLSRTSFGLKLRAVGENPWAADAMGINVVRLRYIALIVSSVLAAIGGSFLILGQTGVWIDNVTAGRGFVAVVALRIGQWKPHLTYFAAFGYGFTEALQFRLQLLALGLPQQLLQALPYLVGILILVLASVLRTSASPRALGVPFYRRERHLDTA